MEYGISCLRDAPSHGTYAAVILAVGHSQFIAHGQAGMFAIAEEKSVIFDVKKHLATWCGRWAVVEHMKINISLTFVVVVI